MHLRSWASRAWRQDWAAAPLRYVRVLRQRDARFLKFGISAGPQANPPWAQPLPTPFLRPTAANLPASRGPTIFRRSEPQYRSQLLRYQKQCAWRESQCVLRIAPRANCGTARAPRDRARRSAHPRLTIADRSAAPAQFPRVASCLPKSRPRADRALRQDSPPREVRRFVGAHWARPTPLPPRGILEIRGLLNADTHQNPAANSPGHCAVRPAPSRYPRHSKARVPPSAA